MKFKVIHKYPYSALIFLLAFLSFSCQDNRGLVIGKIKKASRLATVEFTVDKIVYGTKEKKLFWTVKLSEADFIAHSQAIIKAGVNLEKLKSEDVDIQDKRISLKLPHVEVLNFSYPAESFRKDTLISDDGFLTRINLRDQEQFFLDAETDIRNSLQYMGIVEITEQKTRIMLEQLLRTLGYKDIFIEFYKGELITEIETDPSR